MSGRVMEKKTEDGAVEEGRAALREDEARRAVMWAARTWVRASSDEREGGKRAVVAMVGMG